LTLVSDRPPRTNMRSADSRSARLARESPSRATTLSEGSPAFCLDAAAMGLGLAFANLPSRSGRWYIDGHAGVSGATRGPSHRGGPRPPALARGAGGRGAGQRPGGAAGGARGPGLAPPSPPHEPRGRYGPAGALRRVGALRGGRPLDAARARRAGPRRLRGDRPGSAVGRRLARHAPPLDGGAPRGQPLRRGPGLRSPGRAAAARWSPVRGAALIRPAAPRLRLLLPRLAQARDLRPGLGALGQRAQPALVEVGGVRRRPVLPDRPLPVAPARRWAGGHGLRALLPSPRA